MWAVGAAANITAAGAGPIEPLREAPFPSIIRNHAGLAGRDLLAPATLSTEVHSLTSVEARPKSDVEEE
jgi:hypothetical protein